MQKLLTRFYLIDNRHFSQIYHYLRTVLFTLTYRDPHEKGTPMNTTEETIARAVSTVRQESRLQVS
jgi:hypothetical protein